MRACTNAHLNVLLGIICAQGSSFCFENLKFVELRSRNVIDAFPPNNSAFFCVARSRHSAKSPTRALFTQATSFTLGRSAPDSKLLFIVERVLETLQSNVALVAHRARRFGRSAALRKENLRVYLRAARVRLPINRLQELRCDSLHFPRPFCSMGSALPWIAARITVL